MADRERIKAGRAAARTELKDLDNEQTQAEILNPPTVDVELGGKTVALHRLSGHAVRRLTALAEQVFANASGSGPISLRIGGVLVEHYYDRFLPLLAEAHGEPKSFDAQQIAEVISEIDKATANAKGALELANAFGEMLEQNGVMEIFSPKNAE